ncbi:sulfatase [Lentisphaera marina]|uniref:sulfatase n=1 Tax=Lentisphaera marina TaxID=1111041 RepID=UPI002365DAD4|nr:sulfatase [Lentisphaera marina]MDD7983923.1 sulfatase [Lentisphaera marina]
MLKGLLLFTLCCTTFASQRPKPNILLILTDDLGWQDVKCFDIDATSPMETPNLDALAKKGVKFWQAYSPAPVCAPSRAAILSGHHPARGEMTHVAGGHPPHPSHPTRTAQISPWYSARMPTSTYSLAEALKDQGYTTGHSGKWHISKNHYAYPKPFHHGFDFSAHDRGVQVNMTPDRLTGFASKDKNDPYRLDDNDMPFDAPQHAAMNFIKDNKDKPFFLYYATWLVHSPIVMRSEKLLRKYEKKLGVKLTDEHKKSWKKKGQSNPFYCAMVEQLDYYMGQIFNYLEETDDPRWAGHKLIENTFIIFTSDNGGMEGTNQEIYTDNFPLDRGKISIKEGGIRVPLIITGPGISPGQESQVMVNGLDFYPTILSFVGAKKANDQILDGCDINPLLKNDLSDSELVRDSSGKVRDTMFWHFPQAENTSAIRQNDFKLIRRHNKPAALELYQLYSTKQGKAKRLDIEEMKNLADQLPEKAHELNSKLQSMIKEMGGRTPYGNPDYEGELAHKEKAPKIVGFKQEGNQIEITYENKGAKLVNADLIYTIKGGDRNEEWQRISAKIQNDKVSADLPPQTTHYFINLIDENNFLVTYPKIDKAKLQNNSFSSQAQFAGFPRGDMKAPINFKDYFEQVSLAKANETILLKEDFEATSLSKNLDLTEGLSLSKQESISGNQSLKFADSANLERSWMPLLSYSTHSIPKDFNGSFNLSFNFKMDKEKPAQLSVILRDHSSGRRTTIGEINILDQVLKSNGRSVMRLKPGLWYQFAMNFGLGEKNDRYCTISIISEEGESLSSRLPYYDHKFNIPDSFSLSGSNENESFIYLDKLFISIKK